MSYSNISAEGGETFYDIAINCNGAEQRSISEERMLIMNNLYRAMIITNSISSIADMPEFSCRGPGKYSDDPRRSSGAKEFKRKKKKSRMAAASRRRNRKNGRS